MRRAPPRRRGSATALAALALAALALLLLAAPAAAQGLRAPFGAVVRAGDPDAYPGALAALPLPGFCFLDADGDANYTAGEAVVLAVRGCAAGALRANDVRLTGAEAGQRVLPEDADVNRMLLPLAAEVRFADLNKDGQWSLGDALYLHAAPGAAVAPGDVRLTPAANRSAGSVVAQGDPDAGHAAVSRVSSGAFGGAPGAWRFWDVERDAVFGPDDVLYADLDGSGDVTALDLRVTPWAGQPFGSLAAAGDPDVAPRLLTFGPAAALCFVDRNGNATHDAGEPVYFRYEGCPAAGEGQGAPLGPPDVRLTGLAAGTRVAPGDSDDGQRAWLLPGGGNIRYADFDRNDRWSEADTLYLHAAAGRATVSAGDVRLTRLGAFPPGSSVAAGDSDLKFLTSASAPPGRRFEPAPAAWRFWDADGDVRFGPADVLYIDLDGSGEAGLLDVRLSALGARPFGSVVHAGDPEARPSLQPPFPIASLCFVDADGDGARDPGEAVFLLPRACGKLQAGDLRLSGAAAGTKLRNGDPEAGANATWVPSLNNLRFFDADDSATWTLADTLYLHAAAGASAVMPGDLRLSAYASQAAGSSVGPEDEDLRLPTTGLATAAALAANWRSWDVDGDGRFGGDDVVYLDTDGSGTVDVLDLRLSELRRNLTGAGLGVAQIPELQRTIEQLERLLASQDAEARALGEALEAQNRTLAAAQQRLGELEQDNAALRAALNDTAAPEPPARTTPLPGAAPALALALAALAAAMRARRPNA